MSKDNWETPQWLFDELNEEFDFDVDLCADFTNNKCLWWFEDYLQDSIVCNCGHYVVDMLEGTTDWKQFRCTFMNPPYSNPLPFIEKAWVDSKNIKIVCLLPAKTDTKWFRVFWDTNKHRPKEGVEVRFMPYKSHHKSRAAFVDPDTGKETSGNPCGSMVVILDRRSVCTKKN